MRCVKCFVLYFLKFRLARSSVKGEIIKRLVTRKLQRITIASFAAVSRGESVRMDTNG
jgi:hypothetical protein